MNEMQLVILIMSLLFAMAIFSLVKVVYIKGKIKGALEMYKIITGEDFRDLKREDVK